RLVAVPGFTVPAPVHGWARDPVPLAEGLAHTVRDADVVFAAASGRPELDALEAAALARALGGRRAAVTAVRGAVGDFGGAGGLAQGGGGLLAARGGGAPAGGYLAAVDDFRMLGAVRAGDELRVEVEIVRNFGGAILLRGRALVDGELRAEGRITLKPPR